MQFVKAKIKTKVNVKIEESYFNPLEYQFDQFDGSIYLFIKTQNQTFKLSMHRSGRINYSFLQMESNGSVVLLNPFDEIKDETFVCNLGIKESKLLKSTLATNENCVSLEDINLNGSIGFSAWLIPREKINHYENQIIFDDGNTNICLCLFIIKFSNLFENDFLIQYPDFSQIKTISSDESIKRYHNTYLPLKFKTPVIFECDQNKIYKIAFEEMRIPPKLGFIPEHEKYEIKIIDEIRTYSGHTTTSVRFQIIEKSINKAVKLDEKVLSKSVFLDAEL